MCHVSVLWDTYDKDKKAKCYIYLLIRYSDGWRIQKAPVRGGWRPTHTPVQAHKGQPSPREQAIRSYPAQNDDKDRG